MWVTLNELSSVSVSDGKSTSVTKNYYDIDGQRVKKVEDDFETNYMNEVKYGGMIEDEASWLHYMNARHYNPTSGSFLTQDTYNDPLNPDLYTYAGNNPVNYVDPTGHFALAISGLAVVLIKAGAFVASISATEWMVLGAATALYIGVTSSKNKSSAIGGTGGNFKINTQSPPNTASRYYPSLWMTYESGLRDGIRGIPGHGIAGAPN